MGGEVRVEGNAEVVGNVNVGGDQFVVGNQTVEGDAIVEGSATVSDNLHAEGLITSGVLGFVHCVTSAPEVFPFAAAVVEVQNFVAVESQGGLTFDATINTFTAPRTGLYSLSINLSWDGTSDGLRAVGFLVNNVVSLFTSNNVGLGAFGHSSLSFVQKLVAGDTVRPFAGTTVAPQTVRSDSQMWITQVQ